jgi:probable biosynthetic protein (TIGR04098 family)
MRYTYDLTLGLPHTNHRGLAEHLLLKYAGHFQWASISAAAGVPLSSLRTAEGGPVYATFYYIEERIPDRAPLESYCLDDTLRFEVSLRGYKDIVVEGEIVFDRVERMAAAEQGGVPYIRFANVFITPEKGNSRLRIAPPVHTDLSKLPILPNRENPYHLTRAASEGGSLGVLGDAWAVAGSYDYRYGIDVDRDTNGAGLVYFANYISFMDAAERLGLESLPPNDFSKERTARRSVRWRRVAYYGNVDVVDSIVVRVDILRNPADLQHIGLRYVIRRAEDGFIVCVSEAVKALPATD